MSELFNFKVPQGGVLGEDLNQSVGDQVFQELGRMHSSSSFGAGTLSQHSSGSAENPNTGDEEKENASVNQLATEMKAVSISVSNGPTDSSDLGRLAMFGPQKKPQLRRSQIPKEESKEDAPKRASTIPSRRSHLPTSTNTSQQRRSQLIPSKSVAKEDTTRIIAKPQGRRSQLPPRPPTRSLPQPSGGPLRVLPPKANPAPARPITRAFAKAQSNGGPLRTGTPKVAQSPARSRDRAPKHTPSSQTNRAVSSLPVKVGRDISNSRPVEQREFMRSVTRRDGSVDSVKRGPEPKPFMSGLRAYPSSIVKATTPRPATVAKSPRFSSRERTSRGLSPIAPRLPVNATPKRTEEVRHVPISAERISAMVARLSQPRRSHVDMPQKAPTNTSRVLTTPLKTGRDGRAEREGTHGMRVGKPMVRSRSNSVLRQNGN